MEMHQVKYFLAVARTLNFTRAAEECNVTQPSLTRAIKLLEHEFGGELIRRERSLTHLTDLGEQMLPLLTRCYECAIGAKTVAAAMKTRKTAALRLAVSHSVHIGPFLPHLLELLRVFDALALRIQRGDAAECEAALRDGAVDIALLGGAPKDWDRFESWPLFREPMRLIVSAGHRFANASSARIAELAEERLILRPYCRTNDRILAALGDHGAAPAYPLNAGDDQDLLNLVAAGAGVAIAPASLATPDGLARLAVEGIAFTREVQAIAVQGRQRSAAATMLLNQLRAADWTAFAEAG